MSKAKTFSMYWKGEKKTCFFKLLFSYPYPYVQFVLYEYKKGIELPMLYFGVPNYFSDDWEICFSKEEHNLFNIFVSLKFIRFKQPQRFLGSYLFSFKVNKRRINPYIHGLIYISQSPEYFLSIPKKEFVYPRFNTFDFNDFFKSCRHFNLYNFITNDKSYFEDEQRF